MKLNVRGALSNSSRDSIGECPYKVQVPLIQCPLQDSPLVRTENPLGEYCLFFSLLSAYHLMNLIKPGALDFMVVCLVVGKK